MPNEVHERLARLETLVEGNTETLRSIDAKLDARHEKFDTRLREVEKAGALYGTLAGGIVSIGVAYVSSKLKGA